MDVEILARIQFALTIMFHYVFPPLSIGLGLALVIMGACFLITKKPVYFQMARFWTRIFALTFAMGVATGIVMEFEFGTNWATYSRYVGDVFGSALAAEGVFAFFMESGFLALLLFGWDKIGPRMHFFSTVMVCLGAHFSAIWIVVANSWMQTPAGFHIVGEGLKARAEIVDFWAMVFNPSSMIRLSHTIIGCWLAGAFLIISVGAYYAFKKRHLAFAKKTISIGLAIALISVTLQLITGDISSKVVAKHQPAKLASLEGVFKTEPEAPLYLFGIPNKKEQKINYSLSIPGLLSYLLHGDTEKEVIGLDQFPTKDWPQVGTLFQTYRLMIFMWILMTLSTCLGLYFLWKKTLFENGKILSLLIVSVLFPQIANQAGWVCAEMGRYPWIVQDHLRISDALSKSVVASQVLGSIIMFLVVYLFLFILFLYLLDQKIKHGPDEKEEPDHFHAKQGKELKLHVS
jgi:cytochrome d ubiquinol oxidase subunit I